MADKYQPPKAAAGNAKKVIRWREEHGDAVKGMTRTGWVRARQLASGEGVSADIVKRMASFNRHKKNAAVNPEYKNEPWRDAGYVAWLGWGGTSGINWAIETSKSIGNESDSEVYNMANTIEVFGVIGGEVWAATVKEQLEASDGDITVLIDSPGGSLSEGVLIFNMLKAYDKGSVTTFNVARAFSIASYIFMAGERRRMAENALLMIHAARCTTDGTADDHAANQRMLEAATKSICKEYAKVLGTDEALAKTLLDSGDVWYTSSEALESNLATEVADSNTAMSAVLVADILNMATLPQNLRSNLEGRMNTGKNMIEKLSGMTKDAELILNCIKNDLTYEQSLEAIIRAMGEDEPENMDDENLKAEEHEEEAAEAMDDENLKAEEHEEEVAKMMEEMTDEEKHEYIKSRLMEEMNEAPEADAEAVEEEAEAMEEEPGVMDDDEPKDMEEEPEAMDDENLKAEGEDVAENSAEQQEDKLRSMLQTGAKPVANAVNQVQFNSAHQAWNAQIDQRIRDTNCTRAQATTWLNRNNPDLRQLLIEEANKG
jgi:ATP-dependent protease ClpP protease subunit